jgi:hypothetical protein
MQIDIACTVFTCDLDALSVAAHFHVPENAARPVS